MNKFITGACIIVIYCCSACADNEQDSESIVTSVDSSKPAPNPASQNFVKPAILPVSGQSAVAPLPQPVVIPGAATVTVPGMNPPHGQPNHRCDIAVGQPLSLPIVKTVSSGASATVPQPTVIPAQTTITPAGMNPPHGQPNHRCDIAVGQPLSLPIAKPVSSTATTVAQPGSIPAQKAKTRTLPGMNPQHGEPGHRCDIAVGAPLNSPVTKPTTQTGTPIPVPVPVVVPQKKDSGS